jgi:Outer membrane protein beta-barrel domain
MSLKKFLVGFFLFFSFINGWSQSNECELTLDKANEEFNAGHFYGIPSLLKSCIDKNNFSREQLVRAYLLLSQVYLITDDPISAEDSYLRLLKADPEYVASSDKDPIDVVYLSKKFTSTPVFTPQIRIGGNTSFYRPLLDINTQSTPEKVAHVLKPGFQAGLGIDWNINENLSLSANGIVAYKSFETVRSFISNDDSQRAIEKQYWFDVPIYLKYSLNKGQIRPFAYLGIAANFLINAKATVDYSNANPATLTQTPSEGPDVRLTDKLHFFNRSLVAGGGARYKVGKDFIFVDLRYMAGMTNLTKNNIYEPDPKDNLSPPQLKTVSSITDFRYVESFFRLDNISLSVGYVRPLYNPRKVKKARGTKSVSRKMEKESRDEKK